MRFDKWIALLFLAVCVVYGYSSFTYKLLPFERNLAFLPNTMPNILAILGAIIAIVVVVSPQVEGEDGKVLGTIDWKTFKNYHLGKVCSLIGSMIAYAILLRPIGFIPATILFIAGGGIILGERKIHWLLLIALVATFSVWYLVQEVLGIFLQPWPEFI